MRVVVIGETGQLARCLAETRPDPGTSGLETFVVGRTALDLADIGAIAPTLEKLGPGLLINAAAYTAVDRAETEPDLAHVINADAPAAMAAWCTAKGVPMVHVSTDYVFDGSKPAAYVEDDPTAPLGVYGASKLAGEDAIRAMLAEHVIVRTAWLYSAFGHNFIKTMLRLASERERLRIVDDQQGCPTSAHTLARGLWTIAERLAAGKGGEEGFGTFHLTGAGPTTWARFAEAIFERTLGARAPAVERISTSEYPTPARRPANSVLDCAKIARAYGIAAQPWQGDLDLVLRKLAAQAGTESEVRP